jgi:hypothetical protein
MQPPILPIIALIALGMGLTLGGGYTIFNKIFRSFNYPKLLVLAAVLQAASGVGILYMVYLLMNNPTENNGLLLVTMSLVLFPALIGYVLDRINHIKNHGSIGMSFTSVLRLILAFLILSAFLGVGFTLVQREYVAEIRSELLENLEVYQKEKTIYLVSWLEEDLTIDLGTCWGTQRQFLKYGGTARINGSQRKMTEPVEIKGIGSRWERIEFTFDYLNEVGLEDDPLTVISTAPAEELWCTQLYAQWGKKKLNEVGSIYLSVSTKD